MHTTTPPTGRRTGALWVAGTGAFLLLAAAAVFVAVRWDSIPDSGKLAIVGALTGAFLVAGRSVRRTLPATGDVLFHLGAFLLPVDLAAVSVRVGGGWRALLLYEGLLATGVLGGLGLTLDSAVLRGAGIVGGITLAAGVAATTPVPAPLALALLALLALLVPVAGPKGPRYRYQNGGVVWAGVAGLAPVLSVVAGAVTRGAGVLASLGFTGEQRYAAAASGAVAAYVLGREAARRHDVALALVAFCAAGIGIADGWFATGPSDERNLVALAGAFVLVELLANVVRRDPFWARPAAWIADAGEAVAATFMVGVVGVVAAAPLLDVSFFGDGPSTTPVGWAAAALTLTTAAWVAGITRRPRTSAFGGLFVIAATACAVGAVEVGTASPVVTAVALVAGAGVLAAACELLTPRPLVLLGAVVLAGWAPVTAWQHPAVMALVGAAGAAVLVIVAARRDSVVVAVAATLTLWAGLAGTHHWAPLLGVAGAWLLVGVAASLDARRAAAAVRWAIGVPLVVTIAFDPTFAIAPAALATLAYAVEALRVDDHRVAFAGAVSLQVLVASVARSAGLDVGATGVALCVAAVVWSGLAALVDDDRWREPLLVAAGLGVVLGLQGASVDARSLATAVMVAGGLLVALGIASRIPFVAHLGGAITGLGLAAHLSMSHVAASEPYLAPVALQLLAAGFIARRRDAELSSWVAYTPAVVLLGGAALAERVGGGAGWHAVAAGAVGITAVAAGGWRRLAGPLFVGTALLVAVTVNESLHVVAGVPTWAWLATGGSLLLASGVAMERNDTSPVDAGRRVVDLIAERFE